MYNACPPNTHLSPSGATSYWQHVAMPLLRSLSLLQGRRAATTMPLLRSWSGRFVWLRAERPTNGLECTQDGASCLHSNTLGPAPLRARVSPLCVMNSPIIASFRWSKDEFLRSQRLAVRYSREGRLVYRVTATIGALILLSGLVSLYQRSMGWLGFLFTLLFSGFFFCTPLFARRTALKLYAQKPDRDMEVTWDISEDSIRSKTPLAVSENTWAFFPKVLRSREGFLLYPSGRIFHWLPMHAFRDTGDVERFAELAKSKTREYADVG